jgi:hypothetical protein
LSGFVERVETFAPGRLLGIVDLAQVKDGAWGGVAGAQTAVLDDAKAAMHLAVFFAGVEAQEHVLRGRVSPWRSAVEEGRSPLAAFRKWEACR